MGEPFPIAGYMSDFWNQNQARLDRGVGQGLEAYQDIRTSKDPAFQQMLQKHFQNHFSTNKEAIDQSIMNDLAAGMAPDQIALKHGQQAFQAFNSGLSGGGQAAPAPAAQSTAQPAPTAPAPTRGLDGGTARPAPAAPQAAAPQAGLGGDYSPPITADTLHGLTKYGGMLQRETPYERMMRMQMSAQIAAGSRKEVATIGAGARTGAAKIAAGGRVEAAKITAEARKEAAKSMARAHIASAKTPKESSSIKSTHDSFEKDIDRAEKELAGAQRTLDMLTDPQKTLLNKPKPEEVKAAQDKVTAAQNKVIGATHARDSYLKQNGFGLKEEEPAQQEAANPALSDEELLGLH